MPACAALFAGRTPDSLLDMAVRVVIFDIGGVLEYTPATGWADRWAERLGITRTELDRRGSAIWRRGEIGEATLAQVHADTAQALGLTLIEVQRFYDDMWAEYLGSLNVELAGYVADLRPRVRTALLSNSFVGAREREQDRYGFEDLVDVVIYSHEERLLKPDPRFYRLACRRLNVAPDECVFVDDTGSCVKGAQDVGMRTVLFIDNEQTIEEVELHLDDAPAINTH